MPDFWSGNLIWFEVWVTAKAFGALFTTLYCDVRCYDLLDTGVSFEIKFEEIVNRNRKKFARLNQSEWSGDLVWFEIWCKPQRLCYRSAFWCTLYNAMAQSIPQSSYNSKILSENKLLQKNRSFESKKEWKEFCLIDLGFMCTVWCTGVNFSGRTI